MRSIWSVVFRKEVVENARDRRTVFSALLIGPLFGPALFAGMIGFMIGLQKKEAEKTLEVPVIGAENAPNLVRFLESHGVQIQPPPKNVDKDLGDETVKVVLRIPSDYADKWRAGEPSRVEVLQDGSRQRSQTAATRLVQLLQGYGSQVGVLRLQVRGISPQIASPLVVAQVDRSTPQARGAMLLGMLPYFLTLSAFIGGMYLAIDTTAGERERQSLEPLLLTPASRGAIVIGKLLATTSYAALSLVISVIAFAIAMRFVPVGGLGMDVKLSVTTVLAVMVCVLPVAALAASMQTVVASFAKSFREAQTYLQFLIILPAVPSLMVVLNPTQPDDWMFGTPLLSQSLLVTSLLRGETQDTMQWAMSIGATLLAAVVLSFVSVRLYQRESLALAT